MTENTRRMAFPYPGRDDEPWYDEFEDTMEALDASAYAAREDRSLIWLGGGTISWDLGTQTLDWTAAIEVASPISGMLVQVAVGSIVLRDGDTMYIPLTRYPTQVVTATPVAAYQIPSTDNIVSVAVRRGDVVYFRTGFSLADGESQDGMAPPPATGADLVVEEAGLPIELATTTIDFVGDGVLVTSTGPGAVEVEIPGVAGLQSSIDLPRMDYVQQPVPVEEVLGQFMFDGSTIPPGGSVRLRCMMNPTFSVAGSANVHFYDLGPAAGPPVAPVRITGVSPSTFALQAAASGLAYIQTAALALGPGPAEGVIMSAPRMYEATIIQSSAPADTVDVGMASIFTEI